MPGEDKVDAGARCFTDDRGVVGEQYPRLGVVCAVESLVEIVTAADGAVIDAKGAGWSRRQRWISRIFVLEYSDSRGAKGLRRSCSIRPVIVIAEYGEDAVVRAGACQARARSPAINSFECETSCPVRTIISGQKIVDAFGRFGDFGFAQKGAVVDVWRAGPS
jgi:hypothetical protein